MISLDVYNGFSTDCTDVPIFLQSWWLDAVCTTEKWHPWVFLNEGKCVGIWPIVDRKKWFFHVAGMLHLSPYLGPWFLNPSWQGQTLGDFFKELQSQSQYERFYQTIHPSLLELQESLPLQWTHHASHTRIIDFTVWTDSEIQPKMRAFARKASKILTVLECHDFERMWKLTEMTFDRRALPVPFPKEVFERVFHESVRRQQGMCLIAHNPEQKEDVAGLFVVWDHSRAYYLVGGMNPAFKNQNGAPLLMTQMLEHLKDKVKTFDFCGSTIPSIDHYFEQFGAIKQGVVQIRHSATIWGKLASLNT